MTSRRLAGSLFIPLCLTFGGCGYVHVGRLPEPPATIVGDEKLTRENADLRLEKKLLQQELAITRAQGDALRLVIDNRAADGDTSRRLTEKLDETSKELAELRARYADLQSERTPAALSPEDPAALKARLAETEEKLASTLRNFTELQTEVGQLKQAVIRARAENLSLSLQAKNATAQNEQAQAALAKLNLDLLAEKGARVRAEQDSQTLRNELRQVAPNSSLLAQQRTGGAADALTLTPSDAKSDSAPAPAPAPTASAPGAEKPLVIRSVGGSPAPQPAITMGPGGINATLVASARPSSIRLTSSGRVHTVSGGDTLAKISAQYYGTSERWNDILSANREVMGDNNTLVIGRTLRIP